MNVRRRMVSLTSLRSIDKLIKLVNASNFEI